MNKMDVQTNQKPLVSVAVTTFNNAKVIVETLESIYSQTYQNIELIVSDDSSTDNTVEVCRAWMASHNARFVRTEIVTSTCNTGISANRNRSEKACRGDWVKVFDGDDIMFEDCIENYVNYVSANKDAFYVFAMLRPFGGDEEYREKVVEYSLSQKEFFQWPIDKQYEYLTLISNRPCGTSLFYYRIKNDEINVRCDERIPMIDDWPRWVNLLKKNVHFSFLEKETFLYRMSDASLCNQEVPSDRFQKSRDLFFIYYQFKEVYKSGKRKYALREYVRIKKKYGGWLWNVVYRLSKCIL